MLPSRLARGRAPALVPPIVVVVVAAALTVAARAHADVPPIPEDPHANDLFGAAVAIDRDHLLVGAAGDNDGAFNGGAVYLYDLGRDDLDPRAKLIPGDHHGQQWFGRVLAHDDGVILVGGVGDDFDDPITPPSRRSAAIFRRLGGRWVQEATLAHGDPESLSDRFGEAVAIAGDRAAIAANSVQVGDAYVDARVDLFERRAGVWEREAQLVPEVGTASLDHLALVGDHLLVLAREPHAFVRQAGAWIPEALPPEIDDGDAVIAIPGDPLRAAIAVDTTLYILHHDGAWAVEAALLLPHSVAYGHQSLAAAPGQIVALADNDEADLPALDVITFREEAGAWLAFGEPLPIPWGSVHWPSVAADRRHLLLGRPYARKSETSGERGAVHLFAADDDGWSVEHVLQPTSDLGGGCRVDPRSPHDHLRLLVLLVPALGRRRCPGAGSITSSRPVAADPATHAAPLAPSRRSRR